MNSDPYGKQSPFLHEKFYYAAREYIANSSSVVNFGFGKSIIPISTKLYSPLCCRIAVFWTHIFAPLGVPLLVGSKANDEFDVALSKIMRTLGPAGLLIWPYLPLDGPVYQQLADYSKSIGLYHVIIHEHKRSVFRRNETKFGYSSKRLKKLRSTIRKLEKLGHLEHLSYMDGIPSDQLQCLCDGFLDLERSGWKGRKKTALASLGKTRTFFEKSITGMNETGDVRIDCLTLDGKLIGCLISLLAGDEGCIWKIAFDENLHIYSPGVVLLKFVTEDFQNNFERINYVDSLATADHPMINSIWRTQARFGTLVMASAPGSKWRVRVYCRIENIKMSLKKYLRELIIKIRK